MLCMYHRSSVATVRSVVGSVSIGVLLVVLRTTLLSTRVSGSVCVALRPLGSAGMLLTLTNILKKVATGDELELVATAEYKLREAGHITSCRASHFGCSSGYRTVIHLRCILSRAEGMLVLAPPQPPQNVIDLMVKAI